jgi:hypothetical protein
MVGTVMLLGLGPGPGQSGVACEGVNCRRGTLTFFVVRCLVVNCGSGCLLLQLLRLLLS